MKLNIRLVELGRVVNTGTMESPDPLSAFNEAHPTLMDPLIQCARGEPIRWVEIHDAAPASSSS